MEERTDGDPAEVALENARRKALAVAGSIRGGAAAVEEPLVLGVDTVVALAGRIVDKPSGPEAAAAALRTLSGRTHVVLGGMCLIGPGGERRAVEETAVRFRSLTEGEIRWYVGSGEWEDKAGGYAIQGRGAALVERIEGDYSNVVGLPLPALLRLVPDLLKMRGKRA